MRGPSVVFPAIVGILCLRAAPAAAQLCHDLPPQAITATEPDPMHAGHHAGHDHRGLGFGAGARIDAATTTVDGAAASYQGVAVHAHVHAGPIMLAVHAPAYRLETEPDTFVGVGDVHLEAWIRALRRPHLSVGAGLPVGLPTGNEEHGLGMGHVMLMPAAFVAIRRGNLDAIAVGAYHHALDAGGHHHGPQGPVVAPMSLREIAIAGRATYWMSPEVGAVGEVAVAIPTVDADVRAAAGFGARWRQGRFDVDVVVQVGLAGDPFIARGVVELHVMR